MIDERRRHTRRTAASYAGRPGRPFLVTLVAAMLVFAACGSEDATADAWAQPASSGVAGTPAADVRSSGGGTEDRLELDIAGPVFAGKHEVTGALDCTTTQGVWNAMIERDVTRGVSGAILMLQGVPVSGGSTDAAWMSLVFGQITDDFDPNAGLVEVAAKAHGGDAQGSVTREGNGAVFRIEGTSHAAGPVTAVVRCATITVTD